MSRFGPPDPPLDALIARAAEYGQVTIEQITGPRRGARAVRARCALAWAARKGLGASLHRIAARMGRHHTTIIHQDQRAADLRNSDPTFRAITDRLLADAEALAPPVAPAQRPAPPPSTPPVDRGPCWRCGTRFDAGCAHRSAVGG